MPPIQLVLYVTVNQTHVKILLVKYTCISRTFREKQELIGADKHYYPRNHSVLQDNAQEKYSKEETINASDDQIQNYT